MYKLQRKLLSQNFLHNRKLVSELVRNSSIGKNDLVLEIGPGKGIVIEQLIKQARYVIAIELDPHWHKYLQDKFNNINNLTLYQGNFLNFSLPSLPYKVFANVPFSIEGKIIRKLIDAKNPPEDCYLTMRKELVYRLAGLYKEGQFSLMHKPWFDFSIYHHFSKKDFIPAPRINVAMLRFTKRRDSILSLKEKFNYQKFIQQGFGYGLPVWQNLMKVFGKNRTLTIINKVQITKGTKPSHLSLQQWLKLYEEFRV